MRACVCVCVSQPALAAANAFACACRHDRALWAQSQRHPRPRRKAASAHFTASSGARLRAWRRTSTTTTFFVKFLMRGGLFLRPQVVLALLDRRIVKKSVWPGSEPPTGHLGKGARKFVVIVVSVGPSAEPQPTMSAACTRSGPATSRSTERSLFITVRAKSQEDSDSNFVVLGRGCSATRALLVQC